jgi:hypothetical protein
MRNSAPTPSTRISTPSTPSLTEQDIVRCKCLLVVSVSLSTSTISPRCANESQIMQVTMGHHITKVPHMMLRLPRPREMLPFTLSRNMVAVFHP